MLSMFKRVNTLCFIVTETKKSSLEISGRVCFMSSQKVSGHVLGNVKTKTVF